MGWNSAAVMTSVSSSMLAGLMSRMSVGACGKVSVGTKRAAQKRRLTKALFADAGVPKIDS